MKITIEILKTMRFSATVKSEEEGYELARELATHETDGPMSQACGSLGATLISADVDWTLPFVQV